MHHPIGVKAAETPSRGRRSMDLKELRDRALEATTRFFVERDGIVPRGGGMGGGIPPAVRSPEATFSGASPRPAREARCACAFRTVGTCRLSGGEALGGRV